MLSASGSRLEREPRTLPRWYRAGCLLTRCRKRPQRASTCAYAKGIEKREEEKRKSELCFRFDLRDDHDDDATILILDKYPFATSNELSFHLSISNLDSIEKRRFSNVSLNVEEFRISVNRETITRSFLFNAPTLSRVIHVVLRL